MHSLPFWVTRVPVALFLKFELQGLYMTRIVSLSAVLAAFVFTPAAMADEVDEPKVIEASVGDASPVKLVSFDGEKVFLKTSRRLRIWRPEVGFTIKVNADGDATECELTNKFRRTYVNKKLCEVLMAHHEFEPAHNASGMPIASSYTAHLNYVEMRDKE